MASWGAHLIDLEARNHFKLDINVTNGMDLLQQNSNSTNGGLIAELALGQVQTVRTTNLTFGASSLAMALLTFYLIITDARRAAALQVLPRRKRWSSWLQCVHPAEALPLALAFGAIQSQIVFIATQAISLNSIYSTHCEGFSKFVFPAMFLVGYITLVFGFETAWRASQRRRFAPRGKWNITICLATIHFLILLTFLLTIILPMFSKCFGSVIWFAQRYDHIILVLAPVLISTLLLLAAFISIQLMRTPDLDPSERISASRVAYFLLITALIYVFIIPVQVYSIKGNFSKGLPAARVAEMALFSTGIVITFFHLFLRVNATRMVIRPTDDPASRPQPNRPKLRLFGPTDLAMTISRPMAIKTSRRTESRQGLIDVGTEKSRVEYEPEYLKSPERALTPTSAASSGPISFTRWPLPPAFSEQPALTPSHGPKPSYSLLPTRAEDVPRMHADVYKPVSAEEGLKVPESTLHRSSKTNSITNVSDAFDFITRPIIDRQRHQHDTDSIATVQIGLRFSLAPATLAVPKTTQNERMVSPVRITPPPMERNEIESSEESLAAFPFQAPSIPLSPVLEQLPAMIFVPPSPSRRPSPSVPDPLVPVSSPSEEESGDFLEAQRERNLEPAPLRLPNRVAPSAPVISTALPTNTLLADPVSPLPPVDTPLSIRPNSTRRPSSSEPIPQPPSSSEPILQPPSSLEPIPQPLNRSEPIVPRPNSPGLTMTIRSNSGRQKPSPNAKIPLGAGTMSPRSRRKE